MVIISRDRHDGPEKLCLEGGCYTVDGVTSLCYIGRACDVNNSNMSRLDHLLFMRPAAILLVSAASFA